MSDIAELLERCRKAVGPDREIDREIAGYAIGTTQWRNIPYYTASIDAITALIERELPGQWPDIYRAALSDLGKRFSWHIAPVRPEQLKMLPLALTCAFLSAKLAQVTE